MQVKLRVTIGNALTLYNSEVEHLEVRTALGEHTIMRLHFTRDAGQPLLLEELLAEEVKVFLQPNDLREDDSDEEGELPPEIEVFTGKVSNGRQAHHSFRGSEIALEAHSDSWKLEYEEICHYREKTVVDVLGTLGFSITGGGKRVGERLSFLQYKETQFAFAKRIADEFGLFLRTDRGQLLATSTFDEVHPLYWGDTLLSIETAATPRNHGVKGFLYQPDKKLGHLFTGTRKPATRLGGAGSLSAKTDKLLPHDRGGGDTTIIDVPHRARDAAGYKDVLERESLRRAANSVRVIGESVECRLSAGDMVDIKNVVGYRTSPIEGMFGLTEVVHVFDGQTYRNHFEATSASVWLYEEQPARTSLPGIQSGLVTNNRDPLSQGRVRVQFPWAVEEGRWYRVMAPYAGNGRGVFFTPEVGDEVVVAFEYGDPERGVVIGGIWNGVDIPPAEGPLVKSIITPSGSTIRFDDRKSGDEVIEIHSPGGDALVQINQNGGKPVITLRSSGDISLEADGQVRVQSESFIVKTSGNADIRASGNVVVDGQSNVTVKAGANGVVETSANLTVKAGGIANLVGGPTMNVVAGIVQIQPPGFMAPPNVVPHVNVPEMLNVHRDIPKEGKGRLSAERPTPRSKS